MKFKYQARTKDGEMQIGYVEAGSRDAAANILAGHELFVLAVEPAESRGWYDIISSYFSGVGRKDMVIFTRQLATLLDARIPLSSSLKILREQTVRPSLREALFEILQDVDSGLSFSQALERQGEIFKPYYVEMVRAAELTGNMNEIVGFLADYTEREASLASRAVSALIYPAMVVGLFLVVGFIMVSFVFPQIGPVFSQAGVELPVYTKLLLSSGTFLGRWWPVIVLALITLAAVAVEYVNTPEGRALFDDSKVKLPLVNKVFLPLTVARLANAAELLIRGGIPVAQVLEVIGHMVDNVLYRDITHEVSESVRRGELLSRSLGGYPEYFPALVVQMVAVGEKTGKLEQMFGRISAFYSKETDTVLNNLVDLIQPVLLVFVGILVALLFASILVPLYSLTAGLG